MTVYAGAQPPESYVLNLGISTGFDYTTVTAAELVVRRPDGTEVVWAATQSNKTSTTLTLTHVLAVGEVDLQGSYLIYARLTVPGGIVRSQPRRLDVKPRFDPT